MKKWSTNVNIESRGNSIEIHLTQYQRGIFQGDRIIHIFIYIYIYIYIFYPFITPLSYLLNNVRVYCIEKSGNRKQNILHLSLSSTGLKLFEANMNQMI